MKKKIKPICISGAAKYEVGATTRSVYSFWMHTRYGESGKNLVKSNPKFYLWCWH